MYHKVVVSLFWIASLFFTFHPAVYAAKEVAEPVLVSSLPAHANLTGKEHEFDVHEANAILHQLSQQISNPDLNATKLRSAISLLLTTQKKATECINDAEKEIAKLDKTQKADQTDQLAVNAEAEEKAYITGKKNVLLERKAACRLFYLRSQDLLSNYDGALNQLTKFELMEGGPKRWAAFNLAEVFSSDLLEAFNNEFLQNSLSTKNFHPSFAMILSILLLISAWIGRRITQFYKIKILSTQNNPVENPIFLAYYTTISKYVPWLLPLLIITGVCATHFDTETESNFCLAALIGLSSFSLAIMLTESLLIPPKPAISFTGIPEKTAAKIKKGIIFFGMIFLTSETFRFWRNQIDFPASAELFLDVFFSTIISLALLKIIKLFKHYIEDHKKLTFIQKVLSSLLILSLLIIMSTSWLGYQHLADYVLKSTLLTLCLSIALWLSDRLIRALLPASIEAKPTWQKNLLTQLNIPEHENISEFMWLRVASYLLVVGAFLMGLIKIWSISEDTNTLLTSHLSGEFSLGGLTINPPRIVLGILAFAGLGICVRWFQHSFCKLHPAIDRGTQEAYITIIAQVGFCLSILIALLITGISLSGLAFIAGGLSVGIGFGLQNIISNFISGLILLIERPIKPGDRIMVGNTEGFVKKISVRSTQITTTTMADVIVPNSDLISQQVTNFVFHNTRMKTALRIHVAPENDIYKVKDILLQIANTQSEVVKEISDHPTVVLLNFDHKGLVFELELTLHDVNRLSTVRSNINFDIIKAFRAQHIELASEQIDIFIKEIP